MAVRHQWLQKMGRAYDKAITYVAIPKYASVQQCYDSGLAKAIFANHSKYAKEVNCKFHFEIVSNILHIYIKTISAIDARLQRVQSIITYGGEHGKAIDKIIEDRKVAAQVISEPLILGRRKSVSLRLCKSCYTHFAHQDFLQHTNDRCLSESQKWSKYAYNIITLRSCCRRK